jgi:hypothetical protein
LQVCGGVDAVERDAHAKQLACAFFQARKAPAATIPPQHHGDARQRRQKGKQARHGAQFATASTSVG